MGYTSTFGLYIFHTILKATEILQTVRNINSDLRNEHKNGIIRIVNKSDF